jgi:outer membrane protein
MKKALTIALAVAMAGGSIAVQAYEEGDWIIRAGATMVDPDTDSDDINLPTGLVAKADVDDNTQFGFMPTYMLTNTWAVEVLAATPFKHDISAKGQGAISGVNLAAGSTKQLPPTISLQWYPRGGKPGWQPYIGAGINYTVFFDEEVDNSLKGLLADLTDGVVDDADLDLDDSLGLAARAGVDIPFAENWAINLAVWYINIETKAEIRVKSGGETIDKVRFDVDIDPWVYNIGIAYKF